MKTLGFITCLALAVWFAADATVRSQRVPASAPAQLDVEVLMAAKLAHAKDLLEALAIEDFAKLENNAQQLELLSRDSEWAVLQTQAYRQLSDEFRRASRVIMESAQRRNLDGASLGYVQLTLTCVECHKHVRQHRG